MWSTGATTEKLTVDSSGIGIGTKKFKVIVTKGTCSTADSIDITFRVCTGINEYSNNNASIKIFPNPTTGMTNIMVNGIDGNAVLNIYSLLGQSVFTKNLNGNLKTELDLTNLTKGIYLVKISNENANILRKLIIQ